MLTTKFGITSARLSLWIGGVGLVAIGMAGGCDKDDNGDTGADTGSAGSDDAGADESSDEEGGETGDASTTGDADTGEESGGSDTGPIVCEAVECNACASCTQQENGPCYPEIIACNEDAACLALLECQNPCQDQACVDQCFEDNPDGVTVLADVLNCILGECPICG